MFTRTDVERFTRRIDERGFEVTLDGEPIPIAPLVHGYGQIAYDTDRRQFTFFPAGSPCSTFFLYDAQTQQWSKREPSGTRPPADDRDYEGVAVVDTRRSQLYVLDRGQKSTPGSTMSLATPGSTHRPRISQTKPLTELQRLARQVRWRTTTSATTSSC